MQAGQQTPQDVASSANGHTALHDLFALTDEQILEIEPEAQGTVASGESRVASQQAPRSTSQPGATGEELGHVAPASLPAGSASAPQEDNRRLEAGATSSAPPATAAALTPPRLARVR